MRGSGGDPGVGADRRRGQWRIFLLHHSAAVHGGHRFHDAVLRGGLLEISYFSAILYIRSADKRPLQLILREMISSSSAEEMTSDFSASDLTPTTMKMATLTVSVCPFCWCIVSSAIL